MKSINLQELIAAEIVDMKKAYAALLADHMIVVDGHGNGTGKVELSGLAVHVNGNAVEIVGLCDAPYFSINPVRWVNNKLQLGKWSTGGCFTNTGDMAADTKTYNDSLSFGGGIVAYWTYEDGLVEGIELGAGLITH